MTQVSENTNSKKGGAPGRIIGFFAHRCRKADFETSLAPRTGLRARYNTFRRRQKYLLLCFAVPMLIMWLMYICRQVFPFGQESVLVLDLNGQYVYFFEGLRDILRGDGSFLYSFKRALGGEFTGIYAYYLASPFSFIVALFPKSMITEALLLMFLLKTGSCGLTFGIYLDATRKKRNPTATVIFSAMYALCAYAVVMQHNTMWIDNMILMPIIMLGIENLIRFGKFKMYVFALVCAVWSNFYIGYMMCIFCAVYFFYAYFSRTPEERNPLGEKKHFIKSGGRMALYSLSAVMICGVLLFCTYYSLTFGKTTFSNPNFTPSQKFDWLDMVTKLFIGSYDTVRPEGLPFLYSGTLTLMLLPLYFLAPHVKTREKISSGLLLAFFLVSFNVSTLDLIWHGMQRPNWLNYRYSFMMCFFMVLLAYKAFERLSDIGYRKAVCSGAVLCALIIIIQKVLKDSSNVRTFSMIWLSVAIIAVYLGVLRAVTFSKESVRRTGTLVLAVLVGAEMFGAGMLNMDSLDSDVVYSSRTSYRTFIDGLTPVVNNVKENDTSFYRIEKTHHRKTNDNFALGLNGMSNSTSTLNAETISLLHDFGLSSKSHWSKYLGGTPVFDSLFGIKYVIQEYDSDEVMELYTDTGWGNEDYTVWENPYALPLAYGVDESLAELEIHESYDSPFLRMNATVSAMLGEEVEIFTPVTHDEGLKSDGLIRSAVAGHIKFEKSGNTDNHRAHITLTVPSDDVLYCYFPSEYKRECYLYVNGLKQGSVFGNESDRIIELGRFEAGEEITISIEPLEDTFYFSNESVIFWQLDEDAFSEYMPKLASSPFEITKYSDDRFEGTLTVSEGDGLIFTSIPYDEGWQIYVDGEKVAPCKVLDGLLAFRAESGEHTLVMKYRPACLYLGLAVSVGGLCIFAAAWIVTEAYRKQRLALGASVYGECDELCAELCPPEEAVFDAALPKECGGDGTVPQESGMSDAPDIGDDGTASQESGETGVPDSEGDCGTDSTDGSDPADVKDSADIKDSGTDSEDNKDDSTDNGNLI